MAMLCAVALATADALTKGFFSDCNAWELLLVRFAGPAILLSPLTAAMPLPAYPQALWLNLLVLVPLELCAMLLYMLAIRDSPLSLTLPYLAFTPVFNIVTGQMILAETVSAAGLAGVLLVVIGAYLLNMEGLSKPRDILRPLLAIISQQGSRRMLLAAAIYSLTSVLGKKTMLFTDPERFGAFYYTVLGGVVLLVIWWRRPQSFRLIADRPKQLLLVSILLALMVVTHFIAIAQVEAAYFIAVKRSSLLFGILWGAWMFRERHPLQHFMAGAVMMVGVGLIAAVS